jgi:hypothetical protein
MKARLVGNATQTTDSGRPSEALAGIILTQETSSLSRPDVEPGTINQSGVLRQREEAH